MAKPVYNPVIGDALTRQYEQQGRQQLQLDESIVPVAMVSNSAANVQPPVRRVALTNLEVAGVAGELATFRFEVPPGTLAEILSVSLTAAAAGELSISVDQSLPGFANIGTVAFTDGRLGNAGQVPAARLSGGTQVATISNRIYRREFGAVGAGLASQNFSLIVGGSTQGQYGFVTFQVDQANTLYTMSIAWQEWAVRSS